MERVEFTEDFKDWVFLNLPLYLLLEMWGDYSALKKEPKGPITEEEIRAFDNYLRKVL